MTAEEIVRKLTKAQREYLTTKSKFCRPTAYTENRWMTFPPSNTHRVLMQYFLVDRVGQISDLGLTVRTLLLESAHD